MSTTGEIIGAPGVYASGIESYWNSFFNSVNLAGLGGKYDTTAAMDERREFITRLIHDDLTDSNVGFGTHIPVALHWGDTLDETTERVVYYKRLGKGMHEKAGQQAIVFPHGDYDRLRHIEPSYMGTIPQTDFYIVQMPLPKFKKEGNPPILSRVQHETVRHAYVERTVNGVDGAGHAAYMLARSVKLAKLSSSGLEIQPTDKTSVRVTASFAPIGPELSEFHRHRLEKRLTVLIGNRACADFLGNIQNWADSKKRPVSASQSVDDLLAKIDLDLADNTVDTSE